MLRSVFAKSLRDQWKALIGWGTGMLALVILTVVFYPSVRDSPELQQFAQRLPEAMKAIIGEEFASPASYLEARLFSTLVPVLILVFAIGRGADAIAGEEQRHTLDLLLSHPITRKVVVVQKFLALCAAALAVGAALALSLVALTPPFGLDVGTSRTLAACANTVLLGLAFGGLGLAIGSATGKRAVATGVASAVAAAGFLLNSMAKIVEVLEPYQRLSPFYYYMEGDPLRNGFQPVHMLVLAAIAAAGLGAALWGFERRDVAV